MNEQGHATLPGIVPGYKGKAPKTYEPGRVCSKDGCDTKLTVYNKSKECYLHQPVKRPRLRGRMPSEVMDAEQRHEKCRSCGQRKRYVSKPVEVVFVNGVRHYAGFDGEGTLCEERSIWQATG